MYIFFHNYGYVIQDRYEKMDYFFYCPKNIVFLTTAWKNIALKFRYHFTVQKIITLILIAILQCKNIPKTLEKLIWKSGNEKLSIKLQ